MSEKVGAYMSKNRKREKGRRVYMRLVEESLRGGSDEEQLARVRNVVESIPTFVRWEEGCPAAHERGGWDAIFFVEKAPDLETYNRWVVQLKERGYLNGI
jgi:hypothetical protein